MSEIPDPKATTEDLTPQSPGSKAKGESLFEIFPGLRVAKHFFDYLGGSREEPPAGFAFLASPWWVGIWWGILVAFILLFCGQTSKFIYIDF